MRRTGRKMDGVVRERLFVCWLLAVNLLCLSFRFTSNTIQYPCSSSTLVLCDEMNKEGQRGQRKITCYAWMTLAVVGHSKTQ